jgi:hypothetical protein
VSVLVVYGRQFCFVLQCSKHCCYCWWCISSISISISRSCVCGLTPGPPAREADLRLTSVQWRVGQQHRPVRAPAVMPAPCTRPAGLGQHLRDGWCGVVWCGVVLHAQQHTLNLER